VNRGLLVSFALSLLVVAVADQPPRAGKTEFKFLVSATNTASALQALKLDEHCAEKQIVYYFDTSDKILAAHHLTLRARQPAGRPGDSTVKLRASAGKLEWTDLERTLKPEQDWTSEREVTESRALDSRLTTGSVAKVAAGAAPVSELFTAAQRQLVAARLPGVAWESLKCYGPVEAEVWPRQTKLPGFPEPVTVELWHLRQAGRTQDLLEVSVRVPSSKLVRQFFETGKASGLGEPAGQTKTQKVLDFFKPGR